MRSKQRHLFHTGPLVPPLYYRPVHLDRLQDLAAAIAAHPPEVLPHELLGLFTVSTATDKTLAMFVIVTEVKITGTCDTAHPAVAGL